MACKLSTWTIRVHILYDPTMAMTYLSKVKMFTLIPLLATAAIGCATTGNLPQAVGSPQIVRYFPKGEQAGFEILTDYRVEPDVLTPGDFQVVWIYYRDLPIPEEHFLARIGICLGPTQEIIDAPGLSPREAFADQELWQRNGQRYLPDAITWVSSRDAADLALFDAGVAPSVDLSQVFLVFDVAVPTSVADLWLAEEELTLSALQDEQISPVAAVTLDRAALAALSDFLSARAALLAGATIPSDILARLPGVHKEP